jgi:hypothetical protein
LNKKKLGLAGENADFKRTSNFSYEVIYVNLCGENTRTLNLSNIPIIFGFEIQKTKGALFYHIQNITFVINVIYLELIYLVEADEVCISKKINRNKIINIVNLFDVCVR